MQMQKVREKNPNKSYYELQREITLTELAPSLYIFIKSICLLDINMFAKFEELPSMTLEDIEETKSLRITKGKNCLS